MNENHQKPVRIDEIGTLDEVISLENEWNALLQKSYTNTIFLTHEWIVNWWRHFGSDKQLFILVAREADRIVGIAPLMVVTKKLLRIKKSRCVQFIGTDLSDYSDFIIDKDHRMTIASFFDYLFKNKVKWDGMSLSEIPNHSPTLALVQDPLIGLKRHFVSFCGECVSLNIKEADPQELSQILKKKDLRRHIKHLQAMGRLDMKKYEDMAQANEILKMMFEQHRQIWKERNDPSMFEKEQYREFFLDLMKEMLPKKTIDIWALMLDQKPIAIQFGFNHNGSYITYCQSQNMQFQKQSVGTIMYKFFIESYVAQGLGMVDFSRGRESYKYRFSNRICENHSLELRKGLLMYLFGKGWHRLKEIVLKNKKIHGLVNYCRKMIPKTKEG